MNTSQLLDPEQQKKGVGEREDISGETKGKDGSITAYNPTHHPPEDHQQRINGSVLGVDNIGRDTKDKDHPVPTKMSTNVSTTPIYANSPFPDQEEKTKGDLRQEEVRMTNGMDLSKDQQLNNLFGGENDYIVKHDGAFPNPDSSQIPVGIPIVRNGEVPPVNLITVIKPNPPNELPLNNNAVANPIKVDVEVKICCKCSIL